LFTLRKFELQGGFGGGARTFFYFVRIIEVFGLQRFGLERVNCIYNMRHLKG